MRGDRLGRGETIDLLLVVATDIERTAVLGSAKELSGRTQPLGQIHGPRRTYDDLGVIGGARVALVQSEMGSTGVGGSSITVQTAFQEFTANKPMTLWCCIFTRRSASARTAP